MDKEKTYSVIGIVTIGSDEYRDLIEQAVESRKEMEDYRAKKWNLDNEVQKLRSELRTTSENLKKYLEFLKQDKDLYLKFQMWILGEEKDDRKPHVD